MSNVSPEQLDALLREFGPKRREPFSGLKPHDDLIEWLRRKGASFPTIHQVLQAQGVQTCPTMIRAYCRKVLAEPGQRTVPKGKRAKPSCAPPAQVPFTPKTDLVPAPIPPNQISHHDSRTSNWPTHREGGIHRRTQDRPRRSTAIRASSCCGVSESAFANLSRRFF